MVAEIEEFRGHVLVRSVVCFLIVGLYVWLNSRTPDLAKGPMFLWVFGVTFVGSLISINLAHRQAMKSREGR